MITPTQITYTKLPTLVPPRIVPPKAISRTYTNGKGGVRTSTK